MMSWQYPPYVLYVILAGILSAALAFFAWRRRSSPGAATFALLMLAVAEWSLAYALSLASADLPTALFWDKTLYLGSVTVAPAWLVFALQYTGQGKWLTRRNVAALLIIPLVTLALVWTNEAHGLIYNWIGFKTLGSFQVLDVIYGPWFWVDTAYIYVLLLIGTVILFRTLLDVSAPRLYRRQMIAMLLGVLAPWAANTLEIAGLNPFPPLDLAPFAFTVTGLAISWGLFSFRLLDIVPVARNALIESMSDGVIVLDAQNRIVDLNPAAQRIIGCTSSEAVGQPAAQALSAWPALLVQCHNVLETQVRTTLTESASQCTYDLLIAPLRSRRGDLTGQLLVLHDITERKQTTDALQQANLELQARNQELDAFGHTVAHDLKAPLGTIVGYAELIAEAYGRLSEDELRQSVQTIAQVGRKMDRIIEELMLLAGLRRARVKMEPIAMAAILADVNQRLALMIRQYHAEVDWPDLAMWPEALGHGPWVEEVWANYLSNAIKYGGRPPRVELGAEPVSCSPASGGNRERAYIRFWVRDNGPGLCPDEQACLFTPFERIDQTRASGHGLGLSIVRRIVEKMGGQVSVESDGVPGHGSTFRFTLPAAE